MLEKGITYDVIEAVFALPGCNLKEIVMRAEALQEFKKSTRWDDLMTVFNRSYNLSKKWDSNQVMTEIFEDVSEKILYQDFLNTQAKVQSALDAHDYEKAFVGLADLRPAIDKFFEAVMVMVEDEKLRSARLGLLKNIAIMCYSVADFSNVIL
jgi:glycyl-tRNA synthetase beta chain